MDKNKKKIIEVCNLTKEYKNKLAMMTCLLMGIKEEF